MRLNSLSLLAFVLLTPTILVADQQTSRAPMLLVEVNNSGEVRLTLTLYSDGGAILTKRDVEHPLGEICEAFVPAGELAALEDELRELGTMRLSDLAEVPGVTRKTISFFAGPDHRGLVHGNTFVYYRAEGPHLAVAQVINGVIATYFAGCD